ncbi:MAG: xanthine dehydrogenase family protein subunit M [Acidimicrobiales bacterium]|nr:xanthine dehydrogenase family protein subunit M [Acidimicrobiales bacterium]
MITSSFEYVAPRSIDEAFSILRDSDGEGKVLAGGHSLIPLMKLRFARPSILVDISRIDGLSGVDEKDDFIEIGAMCSHAVVARSNLIREYSPLLAHVAAQIGDAAIRYRGTIGGSICHGDPASDMAGALFATGAVLVVDGPSGKREFKIEDFFTGFLETTLDPEEILLAIKLPKVSGKYSFEKLQRRSIDWAIVAVALNQVGDGLGVGLVNVGPTPVGFKLSLTSDEDTSALLEQFSEIASSLTPPSDVFGSSEYRKEMAKVLFSRALLNLV